VTPFIMEIKMYFHLVTFVLLISYKTVTGQIVFGSRSSPDINRESTNSIKNENDLKKIFQSTISANQNSNRISFSSNSKTEEKVVSLKDILKMETPARLTTRFGFGSKAVPKSGQSCQTPLREQGSCQFIVHNDCRPVLNAIIKYGVTKSLLRYLLAAIKSPCGFEAGDLTLCCATPHSLETTTVSTTTTTTTTITTTTKTTTTTTTTTESTTTTAPKVECGISSVVSSRIVTLSEKIVGGEVAKPGAWPWTGLLGRTGLSGGMTVVCGGSLISPDTIVTAAHCFDGSSRDPTIVRLGEHDITKLDDTEEPSVDVDIDKIITHPNWNSRTLDNDIAIVKLRSNITYTKSIVPVCLPEDYVDTDLASLLSSLEPVVVGWGATQTYGPAETVLRQATVPMVTRGQCSAAYSGVEVSIDETKVCAGQGGTDTCNGDSGGPLLADRLGGRWSLLGITSFGVECGRPDFPGVYTRVDKYLDFIKQHM